jgi:4-hydroxybenzoyl-CoA reductase beta subunit
MVFVINNYTNSSYYKPCCLENAFLIYNQNNNSQLLAGGTDFIPLMKYGVKNPELIISLSNISELKKIEEKPEGLFIGSMISLVELTKQKSIRKKFPVLSYAAKCVASPQIRNMGTIGGNILQEKRCLYYNQSEYWRSNIEPCFKTGGSICHQAPKSKICRALYYSDLSPILLALDAKAQIYDENGTQIIPLKNLIKDHVKDIKKRFILAGIILPFQKNNILTDFIKYGVRTSIDFPVVNAGFKFDYKNLQDKNSVKIIVGALSPQPIELRETASYLINNFSNLKNKKTEITKFALEELKKERKLVRESAVSVKIKKNSINIIEEIIEKIFANL